MQTSSDQLNGCSNSTVAKQTLGKKKAVLRNYEVRKLEEPKVSHPFAIELKNRFSCLEVQDENGDGDGDKETELEDLETKWENSKEAYNESAKKDQSWKSDESWKAVEERKQLKMEIDARSERLKARKSTTKWTSRCEEA